MAIRTGAGSLVIDTPENMELLNALAAQSDPDGLVAIIKMLSAVDSELRYSVSPKIALETACLRAGKLASDDASALAARVARLERELENLKANGMTVASAAVPAVEQVVSQKSAPVDEKSIWGKLITYFRKNGPMSMYSLLCNTREFAVENGVLAISPETDAEFLQYSDAETQEQLARALAASGANLTVDVRKRASRPDMDNEIERIKKMIAGGKAKLNITR